MLTIISIIAAVVSAAFAGLTYYRGKKNDLRAAEQTQKANELIERHNQIHAELCKHANKAAIASQFAAQAAEEAAKIEDERQRLEIFKNIRFLYSLIFEAPTCPGWQFRLTPNKYSEILSSLAIYDSYFCKSVTSESNSELISQRVYSRLTQRDKPIFDAKNGDILVFNLKPDNPGEKHSRYDLVSSVESLINKMEFELKYRKEKSNN
jgi:hypothetical protein